MSSSDPDSLESVCQNCLDTTCGSNIQSCTEQCQQGIDNCSKSICQGCSQSCDDFCQQNFQPWLQSVCVSCAEPCNEKCEQSCRDCTQPICDSCTQSCNEQCNQMCQDSCNQMCQNACSSSSSSFKVLSLFLPMAFVQLLCVLIIGVIQSFNPLGPIYLTIFGSFILSINLSGINIANSHKTSSCSIKNNSTKFITSSRLGKVVINHSHHPLHLIKTGHEFKIGSRYFCTGCYGILAGTIISIIISLIYVSSNFTAQSAIILFLLSPICLIPILVRYLLLKRPSTSFRFISNTLLPISCCFLLISVDNLFNYWVLNELVVLLIISASILRSFLAQRDNKKI